MEKTKRLFGALIRCNHPWCWFDTESRLRDNIIELDSKIIKKECELKKIKHSIKYLIDNCKDETSQNEADKYHLLCLSERALTKTVKSMRTMRYSLNTILINLERYQDELDITETLDSIGDYIEHDTGHLQSIIDELKQVAQLNDEQMTRGDESDALLKDELIIEEDVMNAFRCAVLKEKLKKEPTGYIKESDHTLNALKDSI